MDAMKTPNKYRIKIGMFASTDDYGNNGLFAIPSIIGDRTLIVMAGDGLGWEHVSVSVQGGGDRVPVWEEMAFIKELFWDEEETVVQFHPKKSEYVNNHPGVLHLWKQSGKEFELPPSIMVGVKGVTLKRNT
jgi:hypothetical protein